MNLSGSWRLKIRTKVFKELKKFPRKDHEHILEVIEELPSNPFAWDIEKMGGEENGWRRRVGSYRIFYELIVADKVVYVFHVERRNSKTY